MQVEYPTMADCALLIFQLQIHVQQNSDDFDVSGPIKNFLMLNYS